MRQLKLFLAAGVASAVASARAQLSLEAFTPSFFPLKENADTTELFPMPPCGDFQLLEATIDQMQAAMENGTLTSQQLVLCYMQRTYQTQEYIRYMQPYPIKPKAPSCSPKPWMKYGTG